ncbi:MAG TPA: hypothetical protein GX404_06415 [Syntrophomonadaceae bacterium]|nr:hypothetical protein [Syntrophomonadaceae bacterium]
MRNEDGYIFLITLLIFMAVGIIGMGAAEMIFLEERMLAHQSNHEQMIWAAEAGVQAAGSRVMDALLVGGREAVPAEICLPDSEHDFDPVVPDTVVRVEIDPASYMDKGEIDLLAVAWSEKSKSTVHRRMRIDRSPHFAVRCRQAVFSGIKHQEYGEIASVCLDPNAEIAVHNLSYHWVEVNEEGGGENDFSVSVATSSKKPVLRPFTADECRAIKTKAMHKSDEWQYLKQDDLQKVNELVYTLPWQQIRSGRVFVDLEEYATLQLEGEPGWFSSPCRHASHVPILLCCSGNLSIEAHPIHPCWAEQSFLFLSPGDIHCRYTFYPAGVDSIHAYLLAGKDLHLYCDIGQELEKDIISFHGSLMAGQDLLVRMSLPESDLQQRYKFLLTADPDILRHDREYFRLLGVGGTSLWQYQ